MHHQTLNTRAVSHQLIASTSARYSKMTSGKLWQTPLESQMATVLNRFHLHSPLPLSSHLSSSIKRYFGKMLRKKKLSE